MSLNVKMTGDGSGFKMMLESAKEHAKAFGNDVSRSWTSGPVAGFFGGLAGALSFEGIKSSFESFLNKAAGIRELSEQLEMSAEATQKWEKAADRLGVSFGTIQTVLNTIRDQRYAAMFDPKAASQFDRLGISRSDVLNNKISASDFAAMVMRAGMGSEERRSVLTDMIGRRGLRALPAANLYSSMTPDFTPEALEAAHDAELAKKRINNATGSFWGTMVTGVVNLADAFKQGKTIETFARGLFHLGSGMRNTQEFEHISLAAPPVIKRHEPVSETHDPLISLLQAKADERADRRAKSEEAVRNSERQTMTIQERRISITGELMRLRRQEEEIQARTAPENLKTQEEIADWQEKQKELLDENHTKQAAYRAQLRVTPEHVNADSMTRVGLYSAATTSFNPAIGIAQQQLQALNRIAQNTAPKRDPFQR